ncbi:DUF4270 domain-containing protein [Flavobacterium crassostreae]|uniref:DUF4270 domain-containing protein n=1 Tax=Flavobacterium crassostreae TaxID=1763534 RepID=A0A1B9E097_9FLAO|nr:DUF4270 domain-containing protein [Flavobacterium crassostreae]OCB75360.1 hypothetical protein LPBF_08170 [Flavobacterium crassostreae]
MFDTSFFKKTLLIASVAFLYSCDKDYNSIGDGLLGDNHFGLEKSSFDVIGYNQKTGPVQSNNLAVNPLGIYDTDGFGSTTANFVTQVALETVNPVIGKNPVIESVVLTIPYFSTLKSTDTNGDSTYTLDSIYGPDNAKLKLSVFESGYFIRNLDPDTGLKESQKYYTDQNAMFEAVKASMRLNNSLDVGQNDLFRFSADQYRYTEMVDGKETIKREAPAVRLDLDKGFFKTKIMDAVASNKLVSNDVFKDYFRGLYFKVEKSGANPSGLAMLDFKKAKITINYKEDTSDTDPTRVAKTIVLKLIGNTVSLREHTSNAVYANAISSAAVNTVLGDEKLYLKGGDGSLAILELFGKDLYGVDGKTGAPNGVADQLDLIRANKWLINEASLVVRLDATASANDKKANRVYLYDFNNNKPVSDYFYDNSTAAGNGKSAKFLFGGILNQQNPADSYYKISLTNHIRSLVKNTDSTNVKLGLAITESIAVATSNSLKTPTTKISKVPTASVMSPQGAIVHGSRAVDPKNKLKLEIYYTKSN